jgi:hypothetical protein
VPNQSYPKIIFASRPCTYISIILAAFLGALAYSLRSDGIFSCQATGYGADRYLAYCNATSYGDYDHGAFWFDLEPAATAAAKDAGVLFLGNSRMQFGFSAAATTDWFSSSSVRHYLLGFSHNANYMFEAPLLRRLNPHAKVYVINIDLFFEKSESRPAKTVMSDRTARTQYERKRMWQHIHKAICVSLPAVCEDKIAFFRARATGAWVLRGRGFKSEPVSYDESVDRVVAQTYTAAGKAFLSYLPINRECTILTIVPTVQTSAGTAKAIAAALGLTLIAPELDGLSTFDGSHLDRQSAERWSRAFIDAAGSQIRRCLDNAHG